MPKIPKASIKKLVNESFGVSLNDKAAEAIAGIIEKRAIDMADHAVNSAKSKKRNTVMREDIEDYTVKRGG